jgi:hypothetical protein
MCVMGSGSLSHVSNILSILYVISDLPYFVRNKFQNGFPDDWKEVKCKWITYVKEGEFMMCNVN